MLVVVSRLKVPHERQRAVVSAFADKAGDLRAVPGCLGFELWRASEAELWAVSRWQSRPAFDAWRNSDAFALAHEPASLALSETVASDQRSLGDQMLLERLLPAGP